MKTSKQFYSIVVIAVVVISLLVWAVTFFVEKKRAQNDQKNLQSQIDTLNKKIADSSKTENTNTTTAPSTSSSSSSNSSTGTTSTDASTVWRSYVDKNFGFSFVFPNDNWKNYVVKTFTPINGPATKYIYFCIPTADGTWVDACNKGYAGPVSIGVYTIAQWNSIKDTNTAEANNKVASNSTYVYTVSSWQVVPADLTSSNFDTASIASTFQAN